MSIFKSLLDKLSGGTYSKLPETDLEKVIAERDALRAELNLVIEQYNEVYTAAQGVLAAKSELLEAVNRLAQENLLLRTALGTRANSIGVKN